MSDDLIEIEIVGWEKYQHHNGTRTYDWFKFSANMLDDAEIQTLTPSEFKVWVRCLCTAAKVRKPEIKVSIKRVASATGVQVKCVRSAISKLESFQIVRIVLGTNRVPQNRIEESTIEEKRKEESRKENYLCTEPSKADAQLQLIEKHNAEEKKRPSSRSSRAQPRGCIVEFQSCDVSKFLLETVTEDVQRAWIKTYPGIEWIEQEIKRADVWIKANPAKKPKDFGRFMSSWLSRGFENYRKGLPSRRQTNSEINAESLKEMARKNMAGEYDRK